MKDLQSIITKKAEEKLSNEIKEYLKSIKSNPLFQSLRYVKVVVSKPGEQIQEMTDFFSYNEGCETYKLIFKANIESYIETESNQFIEKVEELKNQLDELTNR